MIACLIQRKTNYSDSTSRRHSGVPSRAYKSKKCFIVLRKYVRRIFFKYKLSYIAFYLCVWLFNYLVITFSNKANQNSFLWFIFRLKRRSYDNLSGNMSSITTSYHSPSFHRRKWYAPLRIFASNALSIGIKWASRSRFFIRPKIVAIKNNPRFGLDKHLQLKSSRDILWYGPMAGGHSSRVQISLLDLESFVALELPIQ